MRREEDQEAVVPGAQGKHARTREGRESSAGRPSEMRTESWTLELTMGRPLTSLFAFFRGGQGKA